MRIAIYFRDGTVKIRQPEHKPVIKFHEGWVTVTDRYRDVYTWPSELIARVEQTVCGV